MELLSQVQCFYVILKFILVLMSQKGGSSTGMSGNGCSDIENERLCALQSRTAKKTTASANGIFGLWPFMGQTCRAANAVRHLTRSVIMKKILIVLFLGLLFSACAGDLETPQEDIAAKANQSIFKMESSDASAVDNCVTAAALCAAEAPDSGSCAMLNAQCNDLNTNLSHVRAPAVDCWNDVAQCASNDGEGCEDQADFCDEFDLLTNVIRAPVVDCFHAIGACYSFMIAAGNDVALCGELVFECQMLSESVYQLESARLLGQSQAWHFCTQGDGPDPVDWFCEFYIESMDAVAEKCMDEDLKDSDTHVDCVWEPNAYMRNDWNVLIPDSDSEDFGWDEPEDTESSEDIIWEESGDSDSEDPGLDEQNNSDDVVSQNDTADMNSSDDSDSLVD